MSAKTFSRFSHYIRTRLGINISEAKQTMLQARLQKRLRLLGIESFEEYYDYVFKSGNRNDGELAHFIDAVTTNKTDFFREPKHFEYMVGQVLPEFLQKGIGGRRPFKLWSAGCSTGEEVYTLAMVLAEFARTHPGFCYSILGTDICVQALNEAKQGIYRHERVEPVPLPLRQRYLLKSKDKSKNLVRVVPELRARVRFDRLNFMDPEFGLTERFEIIFFRNVIIYFDRNTQTEVINRICRHLADDGYMFMGHSETLNGLDVPLKPVTSTVYRKPR